MANDNTVFWRRIFPTAHKVLLDKKLSKIFKTIKGDVLIVGGGKVNYQKLLPNAEKIINTDIISDIYIDQVADVHFLPFAAETFDYVIAIEVFEHLSDPELAANEVFRVLKNEGGALVTIPFMFRIHADPFDFQRLTYSGLMQMFNFYQQTEIYAFGTRAAVISDILTTANFFLIPLRFFNWFLWIVARDISFKYDCPSGYILKLSK